MKTELKMNSVDFEALCFDDLHLTFWDVDTESKIQVVIPEHTAGKLIKKLNMLFNQ